jgi:hypothetical protein
VPVPIYFHIFCFAYRMSINPNPSRRTLAERNNSVALMPALCSGKRCSSSFKRCIRTSIPCDKYTMKIRQLHGARPGSSWQTLPPSQWGFHFHQLFSHKQFPQSLRLPFALPLLPAVACRSRSPHIQEPKCVPERERSNRPILLKSICAHPSPRSPRRGR